MSIDLTLHRILRAPRSVIWDCWTKPELLQKWFCPRPHRITDVKLDLRPGGQFWFSMQVDGAHPAYDHCFLHITPQERLIWTDLMTAAYRPQDKPFLGYTAELILADHPDGTDYTAIARHKSRADADRHERMGFSQGWGICADQLEELAKTMEPAT